MRVRFGLAAVLATALVLPAQTAAADGGAYIDFRGPRPGSHFLPADAASATAFVSIPERWQGLLERGPFYLFLVPSGQTIREGRPLPSGTFRLGTATIEHDSRTTYRITTNFTIPDVPGDFYTIRFCNDPCTISGFRESLTGQISIVQTLREATLLNEQQRLYGRNWHLRRQVRKADREVEELTASMDALEADRDALLEENARLETALLGTETSESAAESRPLVEGWALVAVVVALLVALVSVALAIAFSKRHPPALVVPDTIAELDDEPAEALARS